MTFEMKILAVPGAIGLTALGLNIGLARIYAQTNAPASVQAISEFLALPIISAAFAVGGAWAYVKLNQRRTDEVIKEMREKHEADTRELKDEIKEMRVDMRAKATVPDVDGLRSALGGKASYDVVDRMEKFNIRLIEEMVWKKEWNESRLSDRREFDEIKGDIKELTNGKVSEHRMNNALTPITGSISELKQEIKEIRHERGGRP